MSWARVMVPLAGTAGDAAVLSAAVRAAAPFDAEVSAVFAPADVADIMPWLGEGYLGGVQTTAIETLRQAAATGEARSRAAFEACDYAKKTRSRVMNLRPQLTPSKNGKSENGSKQPKQIVSYGFLAFPIFTKK